MQKLALFRGELSRTSRILVAVAAVLMIPAAFLPVWRITLHAPQYPQGLSIVVHANGVSGDLQEVNNLNHYIGMKHIQEDEFPEFRLIPFFILRFLGLALLAALVARLEIGAIGWLDFVVFGIVMLYDFQHWLYQFGHDLSPSAPIRMKPFTPSLLGRTQVANFSVVSMPSVGAVLMAIAGLLGPAVVLLEWRRKRSTAAT